jgi:hypothetical protein
VKPFNVVDLVIVAGQTLGIGTSAALDEVDIPAAGVALAEAGRLAGPASFRRLALAERGLAVA